MKINLEKYLELGGDLNKIDLSKTFSGYPDINCGLKIVSVEEGDNKTVYFTFSNGNKHVYSLCWIYTEVEFVLDERYTAKAISVPNWVVNDNAELGVKINDKFFWLYKGESFEYKSNKHDDGTPIKYRKVGKREFGECCYPPHLKKIPEKYTEGDGWQEIDK